MNIDKSRIIDKSIKNLIELLPKAYLSTMPWGGIPSTAVDLLSRCTLRYANSYGTTYQISQTKELTIISNKGQSYTLESYTIFLNLIIVDYQNPLEDKPMNTQPTPTDIKVGTHWERLHYLNRHSQKGEIITVSEVDTEYDEVNWYNSLGEASSRDTKDFLENFKPRPDLDNPPVKPKPVASKKEANPKPTKSENTFMSKIKASASATVDQNKQALVIASKMEAGRIINKQVLKQLTPHLPFFLQGYVKSPFAPFVAANLVAMVANHTGNSKLTKVSDLMLLGAADSGVAAFNLDKIVDDILSNIKLPAGILDDNDN